MWYFFVLCVAVVIVFAFIIVRQPLAERRRRFLERPSFQTFQYMCYWWLQTAMVLFSGLLCVALLLRRTGYFVAILCLALLVVLVLSVMAVISARWGLRQWRQLAHQTEEGNRSGRRGSNE